MAVWKVPEEELEEIGPRMAAFKAVSHCYKRPTYPDWPYNIFTMVHARSMEACEEAKVLQGEIKTRESRLSELKDQIRKF